MAVRVRIRGEWSTHEEGTSFYIADGHLVVTKQDNHLNEVPVAAYRPEVWLKAEVQAKS